MVDWGDREFSVGQRQVGDVTIFDLRGDMSDKQHDLLLVLQVDRALGSGARRLVLNLSRVPRLSSLGLGAVVGSYTASSRKGGRLVFLGLTKSVRDLFSITKLETVLDAYDNEDDAVASFEGLHRTSVCPICRLHTGFGSQEEYRLTCVNCSCEVSLRKAEEGAGVGWLAEEVRMPTYEGEAIVLRGDWPHVISVRGRLDLFAAEALWEVWRAVPRPRRVVVELGISCGESTARGVAALADLCRPEADGGRTVVWVEPAGAMADLVRQGPPFFDDREAALAALQMAGLRPRRLGVEVRAGLPDAR